MERSVLSNHKAKERVRWRVDALTVPSRLPKKKVRKMAARRNSEVSIISTIGSSFSHHTSGLTKHHARQLVPITR